MPVDRLDQIDLRRPATIEPTGRLVPVFRVGPAVIGVDDDRLALGRGPLAAELRDTAAFIAAQGAAYRNEGKAAKADLLAWADFCQVLFGLNEFVYVE